MQVTYDASKQIAKQNAQDVWYNNWMEDGKGACKVALEHQI